MTRAVTHSIRDSTEIDSDRVIEPPQNLAFISFVNVLQLNR